LKRNRLARICTHRNRASGLAVAALLALACTASHAEESNGCPILRHGYGPFDYRVASTDQKSLVEGAHFFPGVENLRRGAHHPNRGYVVLPGNELDYTLRAFPNHPRALLALSRLAQRDHTERPEGTKAPVECYFRSAIDFRPDDATVRVLFGTHLLRTNRTKEALNQLEKARDLAEDDATTQYNLGIAYADLKRYPEALDAARKAYARGFPLPGLRDRLKRAGAWKELPAAPLQSATPASPLPSEGIAPPNEEHS